MSATKAIYSKLMATEAITAIVGNRIFPKRAPQGTPFPRIVYVVEDKNRDETYEGTSAFVKAQVTIIATCLTSTSQEQISKAITDALDQEDGVWGGLEILGCFQEGDDSYEATQADTDQSLQIAEQKYLLLFNQP